MLTDAAAQVNVTIRHTLSVDDAAGGRSTSRRAPALPVDTQQQGSANVGPSYCCHQMLRRNFCVELSHLKQVCSYDYARLQLGVLKVMLCP